MEEKMNVKSQNKMGERKLLLPYLVMLVGALLLLTVIFLPFASATNEHKEYLQEYPYATYSSEIGMVNEEAINLSLVEYIRIYIGAINMGVQEGVAYSVLVIIALFSIFAVCATTFSAIKKPIVTIIFTALSFGIFELIKWDFNDRGVLPSSSYDLGIANIVFYFGIILAITGSIMYLIIKQKSKIRVNKNGSKSM